MALMLRETAIEKVDQGAGAHALDNTLKGTAIGQNTMSLLPSKTIEMP